MDTSELLRRGVIGLALLGIAGTSVELVFLRHWDGVTQLIVWPALLLLMLAAGLLLLRPGPGTVRTARWVAALVAVVALAGIGLHLVENLGAGPLDARYALTWDTLSPMQQLWTAATGGVGPAPVLAPGVLAEISLALLLGTLHHPAMEDAGAPAGR